MAIDDIAAQFGVTLEVVRPRPRLAAVSPKLMERYREGRLTLAHMMAFAITDDHARQEAIHKAEPDAEPYLIKRLLTQKSVRGSDRRVQFVGLAFYEPAGGRVTRDLFADEDNVFVDDVELLDTLVTEKLNAERDKVAAEGWLWVECFLQRSYDRSWSSLPPYEEESFEEDMDRLVELENEIDEIESSDESSDYETDSLPELKREADALRIKTTTYPDEIKCKAGQEAKTVGALYARSGPLQRGRGSRRPSGIAVRRRRLPRARSSRARVCAQRVHPRDQPQGAAARLFA
jgi:ParB family chromosome partitioning protein